LACVIEGEIGKLGAQSEELAIKVSVVARFATRSKVERERLVTYFLTCAREGKRKGERNKMTGGLPEE